MERKMTWEAICGGGGGGGVDGAFGRPFFAMRL
jgi:hypothetical protein